MQSNDNLNSAIALYFEALYTCNLDLVDKVFHPSASLFDTEHGTVTIDPIVNYRQTLAERIPPKQTNQSRQDEVLLIDRLSDTVAMVKVRIKIHQNIFVDHLSYVKSESGWQIVAKIWHFEKTALQEN